jgi:hypothetical protein
MSLNITKLLEEICDNSITDDLRYVAMKFCILGHIQKGSYNSMICDIKQKGLYDVYCQLFTENLLIKWYLKVVAPNPFFQIEDRLEKNVEFAQFFFSNDDDYQESMLTILDEFDDGVKECYSHLTCPSVYPEDGISDITFDYENTDDDENTDNDEIDT